MFESNTSFHLYRTGHFKGLRRKLVDMLGAGEVAAMGDNEVEKWFKDNGYATYVLYTGEYDDCDDILVAKREAVEGLVDEADAFWVHR